MLLCDLMSAVLCSAQKGSNIATIIRSNDALLQLLVQEKKGEQKNERFLQDFKTLADVLIQEMVRHDLSEKFSGLEDSIYGEETNRFTNALGETITIKLCSTETETQSLLVKVLDGNNKAAGLLSQCLHSTVCLPLDERIQQLTHTIDKDDIGVWIDPIDSTNQYIQGDIGVEKDVGIIDEGLQCVTVLVGVFIKSTGLPILGVVIQPFNDYNTQTKQWSEKIIWGVCYEDIKLSSLTPPTTANNNRIIMSTSEDTEVKEKLGDKFLLDFASGAGYKLICSALGCVSAYVLSKSSIYKWDCCGPHAILLSLGGGIISFKQLMEAQQSDVSQLKQVTYNHSQKANSFDGIIAYNSSQSLSQIVNCLKS
ncbi:hypothetical protein SNE40_022571 [Patella caerulea]|uniref:Inositol polyphosphate 1-phosphatase n=1 Tax=Patella caerulea TaxID=87958 RepID=A0AAN8IV54_PATCE